MKGIIIALLLGVVLGCANRADASQTQGNYQKVTVAEYVEHHIDVLADPGKSNRNLEYHDPGAAFIKLHFSRFRPPPGTVIEVRNPSGTESYLYSRETKDPLTFDPDLGDDGITSFSSMSISGDTAVIEVHSLRLRNGQTPRGLANLVTVDRVVRGFSATAHDSNATDAVRSKVSGQNSTQAFGSGPYLPESTCGASERLDAMCWADSDPDAYGRSRAVAKLLIGTSSCTAWRVGSGNYLFTNNHCIASRSEAASAEVWFNYERVGCGSGDPDVPVKVPGDSLLSTDYNLDYALFTVSDFSRIESFGNLGLEVSEARLADEIYIPQHGAGAPRQIALESDLNPSGLCEVDDTNVYGRDTGTDVGYYCDTTGGSSGSPVVLAGNGRAIALHHFGGCLNSGVKMSLIWPKVKRFFGGVVPAGSFGDPVPDPNPDPEPEPNQAPTAAFSFSCSFLDCQFDAAASSDPAGAIAGYRWVFGDSAAGSGVSADHSYAAAGAYAVTLEVTDADGAAGTQTKTVTVAAAPSDPVPENQPPVAEFTFSCQGANCSFNADASHDSDGVIVSYAWNFGDGASASGSSVPHTYAADGVYEVRLTVTDDLGAAASASRPLTLQTTVSPRLELVGRGFKERGKKWAELDWAGSEASQIEVFRDGVGIATMENSGHFTDVSVDNKIKSAIYKVCEARTLTCSNELEISF